MSTSDGDPGRAPGAVRVDPDRVGAGGDEGRPESAASAQPTRAEAEARAEQIHAEVADTEVRRAEDQAARADEAVEEAERQQRAAHQAEEDARGHAQEVRRDADDHAQRVPTTVVVGTGGRTSIPSDGGNPIVFGPFTAERPELLVAAAFVGGFLLAKIIRAMAS
jgi:hypothetical protein